MDPGAGAALSRPAPGSDGVHRSAGVLAVMTATWEPFLWCLMFNRPHTCLKREVKVSSAA